MEGGYIVDSKDWGIEVGEGSRYQGSSWVYGLRLRIGIGIWMARSGTGGGEYAELDGP